MPSGGDTRVCVGGALFRGDDLLLLRRADTHRGRWEIPGGSVERGEGLREALAREIREETGLSARIGRPFYASTFTTVSSGGRRVEVVAIEFLGGVASRRTVRLSAEHDAWAWVSRRALPRYRLGAWIVPAVRAVYRAHAGSGAGAARARATG